MVITNAFSLNMLDVPDVTGADKQTFNVEITAVSDDFVRRAVQLHIAEGKAVTSAVGHQDTANVFSSVLGVPVACNRTNVVLEKGQTIMVGQYSGPRLPEGATTLPEGATIKWFFVTLS